MFATAFASPAASVAIVRAGTTNLEEPKLKKHGHAFTTVKTRSEAKSNDHYWVWQIIEMKSLDGYSTYSAIHITVQSDTPVAVDAVATAAAALDGLLPDSLIILWDCNVV